MANFPIDNPRLAAGLIESVEKKRRDESYVRYWTPFEYQKKAFEKFTDDIKILIVAGGNRCLAGDTLIATPGGARPIKSILPGDLVYSQDGSTVPVLEKYNNGPKELWRFYGKRRNHELYIDATEEHKILAASEKDNTPRLVALGNLKDRWYFSRHEGIEFGQQEYPLALLIGLLLGDGYIAGNDTQWTCAEPELVELLRPYIESFGFKLKSHGIQHYISDPLAIAAISRDIISGKVLGTAVRHRLRLELRRLGLLGTKSGTKFIPAEVWNWKKADVAQLLSGLIATDGSVFETHGCWHFIYTSKSRDLIEGVQKLLGEGFGIYGGTITKGSKGTWDVSYGTAQAFERLAQLPVPGRKGRLIKQASFTKKDSKASLVKFVDREFLGELPTFDILIDHPSHVFLTANNLSVKNSGKTEVGAAITVAYALGKDYFKGDPAESWVKDLPIPEKKNRNVWLVGLDFKVLKDVIWREKLLAGANHPGFLPKGDPPIENILERDQQIFFTDGPVISGKSADSGREKFQSASVDLVWIDEECDAEIFDECYQRTVDCGGRIIVTVTPLIDINSGVKTPWIYNLWEDRLAGRKDIAFVNLSVLDNPIVPEAEKQKLLEKWKGHPEERARLFGEFVRRSGIVYPMWSRKIHVQRTNPSPDWQTIVSIDPAATGITAALWCRVDPSGNLHLYKEYYNADLTVGEHVINIKTRNRGDKVDIWYIDPTWGGQRNAENHKTGQQLYRDAGIPVRLAEVGEDFGILASLEYMQATCLGPESRNPKVYVDPSLTNFMDEIEHYIYDSYHSGPLKGMSKDRPRKKADHLMNAYQYIAAQRPRGRRRADGEGGPTSSGSYF